MNEASQWRLQIARYVAPIIARHPNVVAVMLGGSASRGNADRHSDIEIGVFWSKPPADADRLAPIAPAGGVFWELDPFNAEDSVWMEEWGMGGVKMDIRNLTVERMEAIIRSVVKQGASGDFEQETLSALQHGLPLYNLPVIERWQAQIATYPAALAQAMVREHMDLGEWCWWTELVASRRDFTLVYGAFSGLTEQMLSILLGVNRIYYPGFKWLHRLIAELTIAPPDLDTRIQQAYQTTNLSAATAILRQLMLETFDLVDQHMPEIETTEARRAFLKLRPQFTQMPPELLSRLSG